MCQEPNLEERISEAKKTPLTLTDHLKYFVVDGTSNALFYAPIMTATERFSGMEWEEVTTSRGIGAATAFLTGYAYSLFRQWSAKTAGATTESSQLKKKIVDTAVGMAAMIPFYAPMLYIAGASAKEMMMALLSGSAMGAATGGAYGHVADKWRVLWGLQPVLNK